MISRIFAEEMGLVRESAVGFNETVEKDLPAYDTE